MAFRWTIDDVNLTLEAEYGSGKWMAEWSSFADEAVEVARALLAALPPDERRSLFRDAATDLIAKDDLVMLVGALLDAMAPSDLLKAAQEGEDCAHDLDYFSDRPGLSRAGEQAYKRIHDALAPWLDVLR
jgi:hypothetical protein